MINALLTPEQRQFAEAVDRFVAREYRVTTARPAHDFDRARLGRLGDLGVLALGVPEARGGMGGDVELLLAAERLGPALAREPFVGCGVIAAGLLAAAPEISVPARRLAALIAGEILIVPALTERSTQDDRPVQATSAEPVPGGWHLNGVKTLVEAAGHADAFLVSARETGASELSLFLIEASTPGVSLRNRARLDGMPACDVTLTGCFVPATCRLDIARLDPALDLAFDRAEAAGIAMMVGIMDALIRTTIDYLRTRRQFGQPIGSFQALQHRVADMWIACEETRSLAFAAALACAGSAEVRRQTLSLAKIRACDAAQLVGAESIQMHGGIGMTDDLIVSHWYKRLLALRQSGTTRGGHLGRLAAGGLD